MGTYAVIEGNKIVNIIIWDEKSYLFPSLRKKMVTLEKGMQIGSELINGEWVILEKEQENTSQEYL